MPDSFPFALTLAGLFAVAMLRGQATYWLARVVTEQADRRTRKTQETRPDTAIGRLRDRLQGDRLRRGRDAIRRYGLPAISLCYLTVGLQTLVLASAGALRIRWPRFTLAQVPGAAAWATIYATVGFAAWTALIDRAVTSGPFGLAVAFLAGAGTLTWWLRRRVRRRAALPEGPDGTGEQSRVDDRDRPESARSVESTS